MSTQIDPPTLAECVVCGGTFDANSDDDDVCKGCIEGMKAEYEADRYNDERYDTNEDYGWEPPDSDLHNEH